MMHQSIETPASSVGRTIGVIVLTLAALFVGFVALVLAVFALSYVESGRGIGLPLEISGLIGGAVMGALGALPLAISQRRAWIVAAGSGVIAVLASCGLALFG